MLNKNFLTDSILTLPQGATGMDIDKGVAFNARHFKFFLKMDFENKNCQTEVHLLMNHVMEANIAIF